MEISRKESIVTFFINLILLLITISCIIVLEGSLISLILSLIIVIFIFVSSVINWSLRHHRDDNNN